MAARIPGEVVGAGGPPPSESKSDGAALPSAAAPTPGVAGAVAPSTKPATPTSSSTPATPLTPDEKFKSQIDQCAQLLGRNRRAEAELRASFATNRTGVTNPYAIPDPLFIPETLNKGIVGLQKQIMDLKVGSVEVLQSDDKAKFKAAMSDVADSASLAVSDFMLGHKLETSEIDKAVKSAQDVLQKCEDNLEVKKKEITERKRGPSDLLSADDQKQAADIQSQITALHKQKEGLAKVTKVPDGLVSEAVEKVSKGATDRLKKLEDHQIKHGIRKFRASEHIDKWVAVEDDKYEGYGTNMPLEMMLDDKFIDYLQGAKSRIYRRPIDVDKEEGPEFVVKYDDTNKSIVPIFQDIPKSKLESLMDTARAAFSTNDYKVDKYQAGWNAALTLLAAKSNILATGVIFSINTQVANAPELRKMVLDIFSGMLDQAGKLGVKVNFDITVLEAAHELPPKSKLRIKILEAYEKSKEHNKFPAPVTDKRILLSTQMAEIVKDAKEIKVPVGDVKLTDHETMLSKVQAQREKIDNALSEISRLEKPGEGDTAAIREPKVAALLQKVTALEEHLKQLAQVTSAVYNQLSTPVAGETDDQKNKRLQVLAQAVQEKEAMSTLLQHKEDVVQSIQRIGVTQPMKLSVDDLKSLGGELKGSSELLDRVAGESVESVRTKVEGGAATIQQVNRALDRAYLDLERASEAISPKMEEVKALVDQISKVRDELSKVCDKHDAALATKDAAGQSVFGAPAQEEKERNDRRGALDGVRKNISEDLPAKVNAAIQKIKAKVPGADIPELARTEAPAPVHGASPT